MLRPTVSAALVAADLGGPTVTLVDSGCEHVLVAPWVAQDAAVDLQHPKFEDELGIGGGWVKVSYFDLAIRLFYPGGSDDQYLQWETEIGVLNGKWSAPWGILLGQYGFLDHFTVSMHRSAALTVVEDWSEFDRRFGVSVAPAG